MSSVLTRSHVPTIIVLGVLFGTNLVVSRFSLGQLHPFVLVAVRISVAAGLALLWGWVRGGGLPRGWTVWVHGAVTGVFSTAAPMLCFISALQYQSSGVTALFVSLTPISAMIYAHFLLPDDRMTTRKVIGAIVSFGGVGLLLATGETGLGVPRWEGFALMFCGVAVNGYGLVHVRKYLSRARSLDITIVRLVVASAITVPLAWLTVGFDFSRLQWSGVLALTYSVIFGTFLSFFLYSFVVARFGPTRSSQTEYLVPIVAVVTGAVFLGEQISLIVIIGMLTVITGIVIATWRSSLP